MRKLILRIAVFMAKKLEVVLLRSSQLLKKWWLALGYKRDEWFRAIDL